MVGCWSTPSIGNQSRHFPHVKREMKVWFDLAVDSGRKTTRGRWMDCLGGDLWLGCIILFKSRKIEHSVESKVEQLLTRKSKKMWLDVVSISLSFVFIRSKSDARNLSCRTSSYGTSETGCWSKSTEDSIRRPIKRPLSNASPPMLGSCPTAKV